ncbi:mannose-1-phosphate guanylyltransferase/mannose-6-phosphate isomerase [Janthinobacterium sp. GW460P]|uniref:mannose-1-phosphate guanylyltransferase/mannose-6-phosphate isomerase n=1 Tax=unclassified Janthinobacterium TaxID=2610881 RepID=UPI000A327B47|nr:MULTISPECIES: mannose-1-phosphate guanylyltransferase/mannose-6-phosphate isomerase [unclassified Janthinobacterium]MCC7701290.1 mannose-1-phosphate guanylyltransferase/mannose-6-phosphate isomerase [Janthinobacterium sp. GW460P]MCC7706797.1 mannose-1-phosphate guanylyltransferase/mannose-6-phosphate isomerase [Janthinobacterium sp. GW460W]
MNIYPVILSGGSGSRLWPLSRQALPKQLLPLVSSQTLLQETVLRVRDLGGVGLAVMPPLLVCGNEHRFMVAEQLRQVGVAPLAILLEPLGRNTAPAVAAAAQYLLAHDADALMLVLPADHLVGDTAAFHRAIAQAAPLAAAGGLATFGILPTAAETGYGYILAGVPLPGSAQGRQVERFVEKPDLSTARAFLADERYMWNSGMFLLRAAAFLGELLLLEPAMLADCELAVAHGCRDLDFFRLDPAAFARCRSVSIDHAVMEHTQRAVVVPAAIGWSDIGSWSALWQALPGDEHGNVVRGDAYLDGVHNCLVRAGSRMLAVLGVDDLVIVETDDAVLVAHRDQVQRVRQVVEHLERHARTEHVQHRLVYRPWGSYEGIDMGERFQVKRIVVNPGGQLSLQMHHHRAEHWVVVRGTARVTCGETVKLLTENESTYIPIGMTHRLENPGKLPLHLIEVQTGSYLGEDDIVRYADAYQRA